MDIAFGKVGLSARLNKAYRFDELMMLDAKSRPTMTVVPENPGWLGAPKIFRVPFIIYKDDEESGGQKPVVSVLYLNMYQMYLKDGAPWLIFESFNKDTTDFLTVEKLIDKKERVGLKLSVTSIVLSAKDVPQAENTAIIMTLWDTDDVEAILSGYFTMCQMSSLYIGKLKRVKERDKG